MQNSVTCSVHEAERGSFDLHRGRLLLVTGPMDRGRTAALLASVEALTPQTLARLLTMSSEPVRLVVGRLQARRSDDSAEMPQATSLAVPGLAFPAELWELAATVGRGSGFVPGGRDASLPETAGLTLTRRVGHLPAVVSVAVDDPERGALGGAIASGSILQVITAQIDAMASAEHPALTEVSHGPVPLRTAENATFVFFSRGKRRLPARGGVDWEPGAMARPRAGPDSLSVSGRRPVWEASVRLWG